MGLLSLALRRDPLDVLALLAREPGAFLLEVPDPIHPVVLLGCRPVTELRLGGDADPIAAVAAFVDAAPGLDSALPFPLAGGVVGCLTYEAGAAVAPRARRHAARLPAILLRRYDPLLVFDRRRAQYTLVSGPGTHGSPDWLERLGDPVPRWDGAVGAAPLLPALEEAAYTAAVQRILDYLAAGDVYQANFTQPFSAPLAAPAWALFERLARDRPPAHGAYLDAGDFQIVCASPELLLRRRGARVETRPVKGTRPRGADSSGDAALAAELTRSVKDQAEHVMIVDLERNDLGRICRPGSVTVEALARVESHPTVHHLVSTVAGTLAPDVDLAAILAATFPGGSITGAPKIRAMEIIAELETRPRGVYTGALGVFDPRGDLELALPIRTGVVTDGTLTYHAGGGIVSDSTPAEELAECWLKTAAMRRALGEHPDSEFGRCSSG
jgi:para-aminobenzoate synthetase component 1